MHCGAGNPIFVDWNRCYCSEEPIRRPREDSLSEYKLDYQYYVCKLVNDQEIQFVIVSGETTQNHKTSSFYWMFEVL